MKRLAFVLSLGLLFAFAVPTQSQGQSVKLGPQATIALGDIGDDPVGGSFGLGANAKVGFPGVPVDGHGAFTFYFANENYTVFTVDVNALYSLPVTGPVSPYAGGGLGITSTSFDSQAGSTSDTDTAFNIIGGTEFSAGTLTPFVEANLSVGGDFDRFGITGGLRFGF